MTPCNESCPIKAPTRNGSVLHIIICNIGGSNVTWQFFYKTCRQDRLSIERGSDLHVYCNCIENVFEQCTPKSYHVGPCNIAFEILFWFYLLAIVTSLFLNISIISAYVKNSSLRAKNPNMLLTNQAMVDIVSCIVYSLPNAIILKLHGDAGKFYALSSSTLVLTVASSLFMFKIIAIERFLSLHKPIWHRVNVTKHRLWIAVIVAWSASIISASIATILINHKVVYEYKILFKLASMTLILISTSILHMWSFIIAYRAVHSRPSTSSENSLRARKELKLITLFITMYITFIIGFTPIQIVLAMKLNHFSLLCQTLCSIVTLTSILNPLLTLCLKEKFKDAIYSGLSEWFSNMIG